MRRDFLMFKNNKTTDFFFLFPLPSDRDENWHDAGHSDHIHGLRCHLQVGEHAKWRVHPHHTKHHDRSQGIATLLL